MRSRGKWGWAVLALVALVCLRAQAQTSSRPDAAPVLRSRELQVELATSDSFYLELDPQARLLELKLAGVVLRSYPLQGVELRVPRVAFVGVHRPRDWGIRIWSGGRLDPKRPLNRIEYNPSPADSVTDTLATVVKLLLEGLKPIKVPPEYRIRFDGGLTLAVASVSDSGGASPLSRMRTGLKDLGDVLANRRLQLRLDLARQDAEHLYRAMPPETRLVVLSGPRRVVEPASRTIAGPAIKRPPPEAAPPAPTVVPAGAIPQAGDIHPEPSDAESTTTRSGSAPGEDSAPPAPPDSAAAAAPDSAQSTAPDSASPAPPP